LPPIIRASALYCFSFAALAQETTGLVRSGGRALPGASVEARQGQTTHSTTTDEDGRWAFPQLAAGLWKFRVQMFGFETLESELTLPALAPALDFSLALTVRRSAGPATATAGQGDPSFQELALQQINLEVPVAETVSAPRSEHAAESFLLSGSLTQALSESAAQRPDADGSDNGRRFERAGPGRGPGGGGAFGRGPGGFGGEARARARVAAARRFGNRSRRNTIPIRGMAWMQFRDSAFDARPFSLSGQTLTKPDYSQTRFGVSVGGPLHIPKLLSGDRTFFFASYTSSLARNPFSAFSTLPSMLERSGDFSQSATRLPVSLYDPLTGQPLPGNRIPPNRIDPIAKGLLEFIPLPNQPGRTQNYQYQAPIKRNNHQFSLRLNQGLARLDRLAIGLQIEDRDSENAQLYGFTDQASVGGLNTDITWSHTFTRRTVNSVRFSFNHNRNDAIPFFAFRRDVAGDLGIQGTARDPINFGPPNLNFTNFGDLTDASPVLRRDRSFQFGEGLQMSRGRHSYSMGVELRRLHADLTTDQNARGSFTFSGLATSGFDQARNPLPGTGFDFADFLLGRPQSGSVRFGASENGFRGVNYAAFFSDDWRMRANFTLNAGLRYEYASPFSEIRGQLANLDIAPGFRGVSVVTPGDTGPYSGLFPSALIDPDRNNLSPRVGLAWKPWPRHTLQVRAGYGIYYNNVVYNSFATRLASQPPFARTSTVNSSPARMLTLANGFATAPQQTIRNTFAVDRGYRIGYAQNWSFSLQKDIPRSMILEVAYLGTKGTRLDIQRQPNRAAPGSPLDAETRRLIGNAVGFTFDSSEGNSIYHAGQAKLTRRFRRGVSFSALYTYSRSIDNVSTFGGGGGVVAQDDRNLSNERGLSSFDRRHNVQLNYVLVSPLSSSGLLPVSGWAETLMKNWTFNGGLTMQTGTPLTARVLGNQADTNGTGVLGSGRADATGANVREGDGFFSLLAFAIPPPGRFGNAGRNTIPGPGMFSLNVSLGRQFQLADRRRIEFRIESNNFTNRVNYSRLDAVVNSLNYGLATGAGQMRNFSAQLRFRF
jgi:hypothetical protein